ncbi:MAG TPA: hypothetical protein DDW50_14915 [Firmicutes bacterium]|jgi:hypothetical protein|nr:hypothetical protein [Bacillota bacterium]
MRKWVVGLIVLTFLVTGSIGIYAKHSRYEEGPGRYYGPPSRFQERNDAGYIIHRTANTIFSAQLAADHGRRYDGLGLAIAHQQRARDLYWRGEYREAIYHSLRARDFAFQVMTNNRERPHREYYFDDMEDRYVQSAPENNQLDVRVDTVKVGKGDSLVHLHFGLDINQ